MTAHLNDLLRTNIYTKLATFTAVFIKNDLSQTVFPLSMVEFTFQSYILLLPDNNYIRINFKVKYKAHSEFIGYYCKDQTCNHGGNILSCIAKTGAP